MAETVRRSLALSVGVVVVAGLVGWRSLAPIAPAGVSAPVPNPGLAELMPYATPLADSASLVPASVPPVVLRRDPFAGQPPAVEANEADGAVRAVAKLVAIAPLRVTATLLAGARRAAVINDSLVYVGDAIPGGGRLKSVERDRVVITDLKGALHTVAVNEGED